MEFFIYFMFFILGTVFGSFFTLAVYRIPLKQDILYEHSYCPNCNHKLGLKDLIPILSYLLIGGKCRYCGKKIRIRYLLLEVLSGIVFMLFALSVHINIFTISISQIIYLIFGILYICILFILAGIDKERIQIQKEVLLTGFIFSSFYMIYVCTLDITNMYRYVMYIAILFILMALKAIFKKKSEFLHYPFAISMLSVLMLLFTKELVFLLSSGITFVWLAIEQLWAKSKQKQKSIKSPIGFTLCVCNIIVMLGTNFIKFW